MEDEKKIIEDLKGLIRYYPQACHEFFDEIANHIYEDLEAIYLCLEKNENSLSEYRKMMLEIVNRQNELKKKLMI